MKRTRSVDEIASALESSLRSIDINLDAIKHGVADGWIGVATQLYKLLCSSRTQTPLAPQVFTKLTLAPLLNSYPKGVYVWRLPLKMHFSPGQTTLELFDHTALELPLDQWLEQNFVVAAEYIDISVREFIEIVRNKDAAHYDSVVEAKVDAVHNLATMHIPGYPDGVTVTPLLVGALGAYVVHALRQKQP